MAHPLALVCVEVREEVVLVSGETGLLDELIYERLSPTEHQRGEQFTTRSVSCS